MKVAIADTNGMLSELLASRAAQQDQQLFCRACNKTRPVEVDSGSERVSCAICHFVITSLDELKKRLPAVDALYRANELIRK